jgi:hypothetical protein
MANNNLFTDLENYRKFATATHAYKNVSGGKRFFAYVGPNGKELDNGAVEVVEQRSSDFVGVLAKQALNRDLANGNIKFGQSGVTFYHLTLASNTANTSLTLHRPGTVVGVFMRSNASLGGDETLVLTVGGTSVVSSTAPVFTAANAEEGKAKEAALAAAASLAVAGQAAVSANIGGGAAGDTAEVVIAVAHHTA